MSEKREKWLRRLSRAGRGGPKYIEHIYTSDTELNKRKKRTHFPPGPHTLTH